ncbi:MAG: copper transporter [Actinomycetota bacterium]
MVNFRFHLISLIAVFLALGLGILMGSTVVDEAIVDGLRTEINDVEDESNLRKVENDRLKDELALADDYIGENAEYAVESRLNAIPVAVLAERGVDDDLVDDTLALVRAAGAEAPAVFWLEDDWGLGESDQLTALKEATGAIGTAASARRQALDALAERLAEAPPPPVPGEVPPDDLLAQLAAAGFVEVDGDEVDLAQFPSRTARAIIVTGTDSDLLGSDLALDLTRALFDADVPVATAEVFVDRDRQDAPDRGHSVSPIRGDDELAATVSTVDDLELVQGRVALVIALEHLVRGEVGHYGYGSGAIRSFPSREP